MKANKEGLLVLGRDTPGVEVRVKLGHQLVVADESAGSPLR
jgi:hypothetical protein